MRQPSRRRLPGSSGAERSPTSRAYRSGRTVPGSPLPTIRRTRSISPGGFRWPHRGSRRASRRTAACPRSATGWPRSSGRAAQAGIPTAGRPAAPWRRPRRRRQRRRSRRRTAPLAGPARPAWRTGPPGPALRAGGGPLRCRRRTRKSRLLAHAAPRSARLRTIAASLTLIHRPIRPVLHFNFRQDSVRLQLRGYTGRRWRLVGKRSFRRTYILFSQKRHRRLH